MGKHEYNEAFVDSATGLDVPIRDPSLVFHMDRQALLFRTMFAGRVFPMFIHTLQIYLSCWIVRLLPSVTIGWLRSNETCTDEFVLQYLFSTLFYRFQGIT